MLDIIIFAVIAVFLGLRLFNLLGTRDEKSGRSSENNWIERAKRYYEKNNSEKQVAPQQAKQELANPPKELFSGENDAGINVSEKPEIFDKKTPLNKGLNAIQEADSHFRLDQFLEGGEVAFELILNAYPKNDVKTLKSLLNSGIYKLFSIAIAERKKQKQTLETTLLGINAFEAENAGVKNNKAWIRVKIISDQINVLRDKDGKTIEGNPKTAETVSDYWIFERHLLSSQPNWYLKKTGA